LNVDATHDIHATSRDRIPPMHELFSGLMLTRLLHLAVLAERPRDERGDVPGWVMVTVMTAAVVAVLLPFVRTELQAMLSAAFNSVRG
jgi:hypothetical protein